MQLRPKKHNEMVRFLIDITSRPNSITDLITPILQATQWQPYVICFLFDPFSLVLSDLKL